MACVGYVRIKPKGQTEIDWHDDEFKNWGI
jgi:hypothetical protein